MCVHVCVRVYRLTLAFVLNRFPPPCFWDTSSHCVPFDTQSWPLNSRDPPVSCLGAPPPITRITGAYCCASFTTVPAEDLTSCFPACPEAFYYQTCLFNPEFWRLNSSYPVLSWMTLSPNSNPSARELYKLSFKWFLLITFACPLRFTTSFNFAPINFFCCCCTRWK